MQMNAVAYCDFDKIYSIWQMLDVESAKITWIVTVHYLMSAGTKDANMQHFHIAVYIDETVCRIG